MALSDSKTVMKLLLLLMQPLWLVPLVASNAAVDSQLHSSHQWPACSADVWEEWGQLCQQRQLETQRRSRVVEGHATKEPLGDSGAENLAAAFASGGCKSSGLYSPGEDIGAVGAAAIAAALGSGATKLGGLALPQNRLGDEGAAHLADAIGGGKTELLSIDLTA